MCATELNNSSFSVRLAEQVQIYCGSWTEWSLVLPTRILIVEADELLAENLKIKTFLASVKAAAYKEWDARDVVIHRETCIRGDRCAALLP